MSASFRCDGRLFHSPGPTAPNALLPKALYVRVTMHVRLAVERSRCSRASATRRQSLARYGGEMPDSDWCTNVTTLKSTRWRTGSQCSWRSTGDMWSERRVPVTRRAAVYKCHKKVTRCRVSAKICFYKSPKIAQAYVSLSEFCATYTLAAQHAIGPITQIQFNPLWLVSRS